MIPREEHSPLVIRVAPTDIQRILRALDQASLNLADVPGGARGVAAYRRLAADVRAQTRFAYVG